MSTLEKKTTCRYQPPSQFGRSISVKSEAKVRSVQQTSSENLIKVPKKDNNSVELLGNSTVDFCDNFENELSENLQENKQEDISLIGETKTTFQPEHHSLRNAIEEFSKQPTEETFLETKIEIQEHYFVKGEASEEATEERTRKRLNNQKLLHCLIRSLNVICDICDDTKAQRAIKLNRPERFVAAVILKKILSLGLKPKRIFSRKVPKQTCGRCFTKIVLFRKLLDKKSLERKINNEKEMHPTYSHGIDCPCLTCQNQYGSLGLIVRGMETLSSQSIQSQAQSQHTVQNISPLNETSALENMQEQQEFQINEQQPMGLEHFLFHQQSQIEQAPFYNMSTSGVDIMQTSSCFESTPTTSLSYSQQIYSPYSSQTFTDSNLNISEVCQINPNQLPSTSSRCYLRGNQQQLKEETYSNVYSKSAIATSSSAAESSSREDSLPITLQEFEGKNQIDYSDTATTSSGHPCQSQPEEERHSRRTKKICNHCQKEFNHTGDFRKHLRKHTKEKPYACRQCEKRFSHTSNLHRHERSHTGARPYKCEFCNKEFNRKDKLNSHKNSKSCKKRRQD